MAEKDIFDFDEKNDSDDFLSFDEAPPDFIKETVDEPIEGLDEIESAEVQKKRSSKDFHPDMDALLITAQSPMIVEAMKYLLLKDYSSKTVSVYLEAVKGLDLFIKIIERNTENFKRLSEVLNNDIDGKEVSKHAYNLYISRYKEAPETEVQLVRAFDMLRDKMKTAYKKSLISYSMANIKKYFLLSGGLDYQKIKKADQTNHEKFEDDMAKFNQTIQLAVEIIKGKDSEITKGKHGKDVNLYIIKSSELLAYYYSMIGNAQVSDYYERLNENCRKYYVVR